MIAGQKKTMVKYMHIVEQIKENIARGILVPQDQLPSENELMAEFGVSSITVRKAMETMVRQGIVYRVKERARMWPILRAGRRVRTTAERSI